jgi:hypothetical protein
MRGPLAAAAAALFTAISLTGCEPPICTYFDVDPNNTFCAENGVNFNSPPRLGEIVMEEQVNQYARRRVFAPQADRAVIFRVLASDVDRDELFFEWDLDGDGDYDHAGYDNETEWRYRGPGLVKVTVRVSDFPQNAGGEGSATTSHRFRVHTQEQYDADQPPVASFTVSRDPVAPGDVVHLDATSSHDPDGGSLFYSWVVDGASYPSYRLDAQRTFDYSWREPGSEEVVLYVTDEYGKSTRASRTLTVSEQAPPAEPPPPPPGPPGPGPDEHTPTAVLGIDPNPAHSGQTVSFTGYGSTDVDGDIVSYEWDLDGTEGYETTTSVGYTERTYTTPGSFPVRLRVRDATGRTHFDTKTMEVTSGGSGLRGAAAAPLRPFSATIRGTDGTVGRSTADGSGRLKATLHGPTKRTRAERSMARFLSVPWKTQLKLEPGRSGARVSGVALPTGRRGSVCVRITMTLRPGQVPRGSFSVLGGTGTGKRLRAGGTYRFQVIGKRPAKVLGTLRASTGRARGLPRACQRLTE